jgi:hypothetical protein
MKSSFPIKKGLVSITMELIFRSDFGANNSSELNSPPAVSASFNCGVAEPGGLIIS